ncbi:predicted protein [Sparassis crispa]|uniref:Uncharacterized protein n=1 Tax=Sparassis crispa TaxID=139825 RepID=A0A401GQD7_9APHY|nr:predicted protein [Sparassis crispa]GBE84437.1 predicted protein [Sparassis crispa]
MLIEQVNELKRKRHNARALSRTVDARYLFEDRDHPNKEFMTIATDDVPDATSILKSHQVAGDDGFRLSPIPPDLPLPSLPSGIFPALTEESDDDDGASKALLQRSGNPHSRRSIPVIPIASNIHRMHSNSSLLSSHDMDPVSRSLPRALMDVHMVNFSSSPNVQGYPYTSRERFGDMISSSLGAHEGGLGLRIAGMGRPSDGPEPDDQDKQRERLRAELRRVLEDPPPTTIVRRNTVSEPEHVRRTSATASSVFTRNPSPDSTSPPSSCASAVAVPSSSGAPLPVSTAQHQPVSRASTAAMAAERARASAASSTSTSPTSAMASRERDVTQPQPQSYSQTRPSNPRRVSTDGTKAKTLTTTTATASNLTRTIWAMQEAQRITQQEVQRVS